MTYTPINWANDPGGGTPLSAANLNNMENWIEAADPRITALEAVGELGYTQFTSPVSVTATTEGTANTLVTAGAIAFDGSTAAMIHFYIPEWAHSVTRDTMTVYLYQDGSSIGIIWQGRSTTANDPMAGIDAWRRLTPSSGSRTYSIRAAVQSGTVTVNVGSGGSGNFLPGFIRIVTA